MPPVMESDKDSVSSWRTMRPRPAPIETRMARSRSRSAARAVSKEARLAQAAISTNEASSITPPAKARIGARIVDPASPGGDKVRCIPSFTLSPPGLAGSTIREIGRAQSELQSHSDLVCRLLLEKKKKRK